MSTNLEYRAREKERKRGSRRQVSETQRKKKGNRDLEREIKTKETHFFLLEEQHENFVATMIK